ncbi:hypothetical protein [Gracilimonas tropica]|uniref:hypothetical protein n=1 Tax=Gracilimonas tropica TaxID=454600 RepID=UPI00037280BE|nr:hypothetical protein [Gracilimonas tropica]
MTVQEQQIDLLAIASFLVQAEKLDEVIEIAQGSNDPNEITFGELATLMKAVKQRVEVIETNWMLRLQAAIQKERSGKDETSPNTNQGELINTEPEAVKASGF